jgi:cold shock CspA family protein/ribosome-associated translation inhibitor RaiA
MDQPLQITFRHTPSLPAVEARVRQRAEELDRFFERIVSCRVVVECRHPRQRQGNLFHVRIDLKVPGREIVVGRDPAANHSHEDVYVPIRDAFDAVQRLLEDHARQVRRDVKLHAVPDHGRIVRLLPEKNCGFILAADGNELYFHRNSVTNGGFDKLAVGDEVRFVAQHSESPEGPQASTVVPLRKHHLPPVETLRA